MRAAGRRPHPRSGARCPASSQLPFSGDGDDARVDWRPNLVFPGLDPGRAPDPQHRTGASAATSWPATAQPLVSGAGRAVAFPAAQSLAGEMGKPGPVQRHALRPLGYPPDASVGTSGLELALNRQLAGTARRRRCAPAATRSRRARRRRASTCARRSTPSAQKAAVGRAGRPPRRGRRRSTPDGEILAMAGIAGLSDLQPPGSTFKMITLTGGARGRRGQAVDRLPVRRPPRHLEGVRLEERQRRVVRRHAGAVVREVVQLGLRPARAPRSGPRSSSPRPSASASTSRPTSPAPPRARSRRPTRSATTSRSARRPSARATCRPRALRDGVVAATIANARPAPAADASTSTPAPATRA